MVSSILSDFHFIRPWILLLLIIPFSFYFYVFKHDNNVSSWEKVCDKKLLKYLLVKNKGAKRKLSVFMMYLGLISAIIAAAGPSWQKKETIALNNHNPIMIVLNLSTDMLADDVKPNRLERAKLEIKNLLSQLKSSESGLIVYTNEPFLISPLSSDSEIVKNLLDSVNNDIMPLNGDRVDRAIEMASQKIMDAGYDNGNIVIFTADSGMRFELSLQEAKKAAQNNMSVNIVNMSAQKNDKLEAIANQGNGIVINSDDNIKNLVQTILSIKENYKQGKNKTSEWVDFGWYLLVIPMFCCLSFFRKGVLAILVLLSCNSVVHAGFMFSDNHMALENFKAKNYEEAAKGFDNEKWKGVSYYKAGNYEEAAKIFEGKKDVESLYNYGNALAKSGKIDDAIKVYEEVLECKKDHKDAKYNLEYLKKQKKDNNSKNQKQQNNQDDNQNKNKSEQQSQDKKQNTQNQNAEQEQNKDEKQDQKQEAKAQAAMAQVQADEEKENQQSNDDSEDNKENKQNKLNKQSLEEQKSPKVNAKQGDKDEKYDEEIQAKVQKFREIPEDKGGLLRAFIQQEYYKNRYGE